MNVHKWQFAFAAMMVFAVCAAKGGERFPFAVSYGGETNASSVAHLLDAPAGRHGFVRAKPPAISASNSMRNTVSH